MSANGGNIILKTLNKDAACSADATKSSITKLLAGMKRYQEKIRKHIEDNYEEFMPNRTSSEQYLDEGDALVRESEYILQNVGNDAIVALCEANAELAECINELREAALGLSVSHRILRIDDYFQCIADANSTNDYIVVLEMLSKLKSLVYGDCEADADRAFQKCKCYDTIKVKYHIQANLLKQNLQQRFDHLVQFNEKTFPQAKCVTLQVSKDVNELQDTVMALFQARYNPTKLCDFLLENCIEPLILKPVSINYAEEDEDHVQLKLSYSLKELASSSLRPSYKQVFENIQTVLQCLGNINVLVSPDQHVFSIIGDHIKQRMLTLLVDECLMHAVPETMHEFKECTLVEEVLQFEQLLADTFIINADIDRALSNFTEHFESYFRNRLCRQILESAKEIMQRDLQDMSLVAQNNTPEKVANNPFLFPTCMISKSTLDLIKLMEESMRQTPIKLEDADDSTNFLSVITTILNMYMSQMPKIHEKLLESIPQQSVLFYNNCNFLAHWVAKNSEQSIPTAVVLVKTLQATGLKYLNVQVSYQLNLILSILKDFDLSDAHTLGTAPFKLIRQCLRQLDLLKNVWENVLPDKMYNKIFCDVLNDFCLEIIRRILDMEDISATVTTELSELIDAILDKVPTFFQETHQVVQIESWMKLQQLKTILNASLQEIVELWCEGAGILTANYKAEEIKHLIRALFQNTDRRAKALTKII